jgi:antitoxin component YwqK of YwqJK toxin-antitoxin module
MSFDAKKRFVAAVFVALTGLVGGCGGGQVDQSQVVEGSILDGRPFTLRDGGKPVTGTVVAKNAQGKVVKEAQFKDGFPNGVQREWYDNGQLKSERTVEYKNKALHQKGVAKVYCDNGQVKQDSETDSDGNPTGKQQTFTCSGKLLSLVTRPSGPAMTAVELQNGDVVVIDEGVHPEGGGWEGEHKRYYNDGKPQLVETWAKGKLNGPYQAWDQAGVLTETGAYADGKKIGIWTTLNSGFEVVYDYDPTHFVDPKYAGAFMQAAGIQPTNGWAAKTPLREYKVDLEKIQYYVAQGLVDPKKKIDVGAVSGDQFASIAWTYPYIRASRGALDTLVQLGADPKAIDSDKRSRMFYCIYALSDPSACSTQEIQRLLGLGLDAKQADIVGDTPLHELIVSMTYYGRAPTPQVEADVAKLLVDAGADVDAMNKANLVNQNPMSPLMLATLQKQFDIATMLLEHSKNPGQTTADGLNLVHMAFLTPNMQQFNLKMTPDVVAFVKLAVAKGVDPNAKVGENGSMKDIAEQAGAIDVAKFFASLQPTA